MLGSFFSPSQLANNCSTSNTATDSSGQTSARRLLSLMVVGGGKTTIIEDGSGTPTPWLLQCVSVKWTLSSQQWLRTKTAQHKPSLLQNREARGREDKQRESDGQPECCERGVCCSFMICEKFSLHCTCSRGRVSVCHTALTDYSLSLKMRYLLASAVVLHCASVIFLPV